MSAVQTEPVAALPATVAELDTPALVIDLDVMERNLRGMADYAREHGLRLRPHTKTHKIPALGRLQLERGAVGLTVAKPGEAEVMLASGTPDILVAYPVVGRKKVERLANVAREANVTVSLDSEFVARQLSEAAQRAGVEFGVLAETEAGLGRVGVDADALPALAKSIAFLPGLRFEGMAFYPGHIKSLDEAGRAALRDLSNLIESAVRGLRAAGFEPRIVSGGSTPTMWHSHEVSGMNEIRPGTYIFNDRNTVASGACTFGDCAASVVTTVVSTARPGQMIVDGGSKTFSSDTAAATAGPGYGYLPDAPAAVFTKMNEEHGFIDIHAVKQHFAPGDRVRIIPNHICVAMNLHERVYGIRGDRVETVWTVAGRGKLQ